MFVISLFLTDRVSFTSFFRIIIHCVVTIVTVVISVKQNVISETGVGKDTEQYNRVVSSLWVLCHQFLDYEPK